MALYHLSMKSGSKGNGASGTAKALYVCREGKYADKPDFEYKESGNMPTWAQRNPRTFWKASDENERANGRVWTEIEISLPRESTEAERKELVQGFIADQLKGHPYTVAIHKPKALDGEEQPHAHIIFSERKLDGIDRDKEQFFKRANAKEPAKGGTAKDRAWNDRDKVQEVREAWERHYNKAVHFQELQVSCKSLKAQGIDRDPEPKLGPKGVHSPAADRVKEARADRQELIEIDREMRKLSREIEAAKVDQVKPVSPVMSEANGQSEALPPQEKNKLHPQQPAFDVKEVAPMERVQQMEMERDDQPVNDWNKDEFQAMLDMARQRASESLKAKKAEEARRLDLLRPMDTSDLPPALDTSFDVGAKKAVDPSVELGAEPSFDLGAARSRLTQIDEQAALIARKYEPKPEEREAHKAAYMKPFTDRFKAYQQDVATFNQESRAWTEQGNTKGWTYAPPLSRDAGFFEKTARATADRFRSEEEKAWQKQGHSLTTRRDGLIEEKQNTERFKVQREEDYRTRGTQELFIATRKKIEADPAYQKLQTEKNAINAAIRDHKKAIENTLDKGRSRGR